MIASCIPEPYRSLLIEAGQMAGTDNRPGDELAVVAATIDLIRAKCAKEHPNLFRKEDHHD